MKQEREKEKEITAVVPVSRPGCHYATGPPPPLQEEMYICEPYLQ